MSNKIIIRDLKRKASIGIHAHEKKTPQPLLFNISLNVMDRKSSDDHIDTVLNYETIVHGIENILAAGHLELLETLAEKIAELCLSYSNTKSVTVRIEKTQILEDCSGLGVEITR